MPRVTRGCGRGGAAGRRGWRGRRGGRPACPREGRWPPVPLPGRRSTIRHRLSTAPGGPCGIDKSALLSECCLLYRSLTNEIVLTSRQRDTCESGLRAAGGGLVSVFLAEPAYGLCHMVVRGRQAPPTSGSAAWREPRQLECDLARWRPGGSGRGLMPRSSGRRQPVRETATIGAAAITYLWYGPSVLTRPRWEYADGRVSALVSAPDGHGMILIERRVDLEDATYRVVWVSLGPRRAPGLER